MPICFLRTSVWHSDLIAQPEPRFYSLKMRAFFLSNPLSYRLSCKLRLTNKKWDWQVCSRWSRKDFSCHYRSRREAGKDPVKDEHCARASILTIPFRFLWWCLWLGKHKKKKHSSTGSGLTERWISSSSHKVDKYWATNPYPQIQNSNGSSSWVLIWMDRSPSRRFFDLRRSDTDCKLFQMTLMHGDIISMHQRLGWMPVCVI